MPTNVYGRMPHWRRWRSSKPSFRKDAGTVTPGNASPLNDGAAALLLVDDDGLAATGREPLARISATGVNALDPHYFGLAPVEAVNRALAKAGKGFDDLSVLELNEAFAAQVLGCVAELPEFEPAILNPQGGAIALGHPAGCLRPTWPARSPINSPAGAAGWAWPRCASEWARVSLSSSNVNETQEAS